MDAISDTIVNGGRAIVVIYRVLCYSSIRIVWAAGKRFVENKMSCRIKLIFLIFYQFI